MTDLISKQAAIEAIKRYESAYSYDINNGLILAMNAIADVPTIDLLDQTVYGYSIRFLVYVAAVMAKKGVTAEQAAEMVTDMRAFVQLFYEEQKEITRKALEEIGKSQKSYTDWELRRE